MDYSTEDLRKYSRMWDDIVRDANPRLWERGVKLLKLTPLWSQIASDPDFRDASDDEIASEVKAMLCSDRGEQIFEMMKQDSIAKNDFKQWLTWTKLEQWLGQFWDFVQSWLSKRAVSVSAMTGKEVSGITLDDIVDKTVLDYVSAQEHASSPRVVICTSLPFIKTKFGDLHKLAKAGDADSANRIVSGVASPEKFKHFGVNHPNAVLVPIIADEALGHNQLPYQLAAYASKSCGLPVCTDIYQSVRAHHTGASKIDRFLRIPQFAGPVEQGREYIIVDDHCTQGATINALRQYIHQNGGYVVGYATLSASAGGTMPEIDKDQLTALRQSDPDGKLESAIKTAYGYPNGFEDLTHGQARFLSIASNRTMVLQFLTDQQQNIGSMKR